MTYIVFSVLALAMLALDQWSKAWTVAQFAAPVAPAIYSTADPAKPFLPGIVELTRVHNYGAAWSSFSGQRWLLLGVTSVIVLAVAVLLIRRIVRHPLGVVACFLILSGGIPNELWYDYSPVEKFDEAVKAWLALKDVSPALIAAAGDQVPPGAEESRILRMTQLVEEYGYY